MRASLLVVSEMVLTLRQTVTPAPAVLKTVPLALIQPQYQVKAKQLAERRPGD